MDVVELPAPHGENHFAIRAKYGLRLILVQDKLLSLGLQLYSILSHHRIDRTS